MVTVFSEVLQCYLKAAKVTTLHWSLAVLPEGSKSDYTALKFGSATWRQQKWLHCTEVKRQMYKDWISSVYLWRKRAILVPKFILKFQYASTLVILWYFVSGLTLPLNSSLFLYTLSKLRRVKAVCSWKMLYFFLYLPCFHHIAMQGYPMIQRYQAH